MTTNQSPPSPQLKKLPSGTYTAFSMTRDTQRGLTMNVAQYKAIVKIDRRLRANIQIRDLVLVEAHSPSFPVTTQLGDVCFWVGPKFFCIGPNGEVR